MSPTPTEGVLWSLINALKPILEQDPVVTKDFCDACRLIDPIFDNLGALFHFAKNELVHKRDTVGAVQDKYKTLPEVFLAEKEAGTHMRKHSPARNLHRLVITLDFITHIFENLNADKEAPLRQAVSLAYDDTLASIHYWAVRAAVKAGVYSLPTRTSFLEHIAGTEEAGLEGGRELARLTAVICRRLHVIFDGVEMPSSDVKWVSQTSSSAPSAAALQAHEGQAA